MSIYERILRQTAIYWAPTGSVDQFGNPTWDAPVEIDVRWEDTAEEFKGVRDETLVSRAVIYTGQDVEVGGVLMLGELSSSVDQDDPKANVGAWEIRKFDKIPNLKATKNLRVAFL